ncbi:MAG: guanylate kinase [Oscillospiraceae bacterium]|nr:guanylate kinase [Oscillospiraceae bacterium]
MSKGKLIVVSAPSGCGKGTILGKILKDKKRFYYSVSATTRKPREGEIDGVHYIFMTENDFRQKVAENAFLEHATYCGNSYGTLSAPIDEHLNAGQNVILEIEVQGAMQIREKRPDAHFVFIAPPSLDVLRDRLTGRGTEDPEIIAKRVIQAELELSYQHFYDYCVVNDDLKKAISDFLAVVRAIELRVEK